LASEPSTRRLYAAWQARFREWCEYQRIEFPPTDHAVIARYLREHAHQRGVHSTRACLSALGRLYRSQGLPLDTQMPVIKRLMERIGKGTR